MVRSVGSCIGVVRDSWFSMGIFQQLFVVSKALGYAFILFVSVKIVYWYFILGCGLFDPLR